MAGRLEQIWTEVSTDPVGLGYLNTPGQEPHDANLMNTSPRVVERHVIASYLIIREFHPPDLAALTVNQLQMLTLVTSAGQVDIQDNEIRTFFGTLFPAGSQTRDNLIALQDETVSRSVELELDHVAGSEIRRARETYGD